MGKSLQNNTSGESSKSVDHKKKDSGEPELRQITKLTLHLLLLDNTFSSKLNLNDELQRQEIFRQSEQ